MDYSNLTEKQIEILQSLTTEQVRTIYELIVIQEKSIQYENGILVSDLFESAFVGAFLTNTET